jgi:hypothetical protein
MTRETKVGLVVAASFLCLVGGVLFVKLKEEGGGGPQPEVGGELLAIPADPVPLEPLAADASVPLPGRGIEPAGLRLGEDAVSPLPGTVTTSVPLPPDVAASEGAPPGEWQPSPPSPSADSPLAPPAPAGEVAPSNLPSEPFSPPDEWQPTPPPPQPGTPAMPIAPATEAAPSPADAGSEPAAATFESSEPGGLPTSPPPAATSDARPTPAADAPTAPSNDGGVGGRPEHPEAPPPSPASVPPAPPVALNPPGVNLGRPVPATDLTAPGVAPAPRSLPAGPVGDDAPEPRPASAPATLPPAHQFAQGNRPPIGAPAAVAVPPIQAPVPPPGPVTPRVESYDEEMHRCQPGDTFQSISQRYYHSDKYEQALLLFNRAHPMATDSIRQTPPLLQPGQMVYIPPLRILEQRYPSAIPGLTPLPSLPPPAPNPAMAPIQPVPPQPPVARPVGPAPSAGVAPFGEKKYRVRAGGERFFDIAQRTLGSGQRWGEIYKLNQGFNPNYPVPAGAVLRMPAAACIDPADMP